MKGKGREGRNWPFLPYENFWIRRWCPSSNWLAAKWFVGESSAVTQLYTTNSQFCGWVFAAERSSPVVVRRHDVDAWNCPVWQGGTCQPECLPMPTATTRSTPKPSTRWPTDTKKTPPTSKWGSPGPSVRRRIKARDATSSRFLDDNAARAVSACGWCVARWGVECR